MTREVLDALSANSFQNSEFSFQETGEAGECGIMNSECGIDRDGCRSADHRSAPDPTQGPTALPTNGRPYDRDEGRAARRRGASRSARESAPHPVGEELAPPADTVQGPTVREDQGPPLQGDEQNAAPADPGAPRPAPRSAEHRSATDPAPGPTEDERHVPDNSEFRIHNSELYSHYAALCAQEAALRAEFPDFRLAEALRDPAFLRLTAPATGVPPRAAWLALHPEAMERRAEHRARQQAAEDARRQLALAVSAGSLRPREGGGQQAAALLESDPRRLSPRARQELRQRILDAAARGEKIYP